MNEVAAEQVEFLWPGRIALGKSHLFVGNPGLGKSFVMLDIAARVTTGSEWPDDSGAAPQGSVVLLVGEDGLADTIKPRLDIHGADASRVFVIQSRTIKTEGGESMESPVRLDRDIQAIDRALAELDDVRIVFIDPISEYLGSTDSHKNSEVRGLLAPLAKMAEKHNIAIVSISHLNKSTGGPAIYRAMGSLAFTAHARISWAFVADHEDPDRILFLPLKNNLHKRIPGLAFRIVAAPGDPQQGMVEWETGPVDVSADDALNPEPPGKRSKLEDAVEWLQSRLADECVTCSQITKEAKAEGIAFKTLQRARKQLGVVSSKDRMSEKGEWWLSLPKSSEPSGSPVNFDGSLDCLGSLVGDSQGGQECESGPLGFVDQDDW